MVYNVCGRVQCVQCIMGCDVICLQVCDGASPEGYFRLKASLFAELQVSDYL